MPSLSMAERMLAARPVTVQSAIIPVAACVSTMPPIGNASRSASVASAIVYPFKDAIIFSRDALTRLPLRLDRLLSCSNCRKVVSPLAAPRTTWENVQSQKELIRFRIDRLGLAKSSDINTGPGEVWTFALHHRRFGQFFRGGLRCWSVIPRAICSNSCFETTVGVAGPVVA